MNEDVLVLFSGGADSRLMLEFARLASLKPYCLLINYEQLHQEELHAAESQLADLDSLVPEWHTVHIKHLNVNSGLTGDGDKNDTGEVHEMHVPGRNSMFLSCALSVAESRGIDRIWLGCDWSDRLNLFPDCYQEYIVKVNEMFELAGPNKIRVEAPLMGMSKEMVISMLIGLGIDGKNIFSGYGEL